MTATHWVVMAIFIVCLFIYDWKRPEDKTITLCELFANCPWLAKAAMKRAQTAGLKATPIHVDIPPKQREQGWGCEVANVWWVRNGRYMAGYYANDEHYTPRIYCRLVVDLPPDTLGNRCYEVRDVTSVWQKAEIEQVKNCLQKIAA